MKGLHRVPWEKIVGEKKSRNVFFAFLLLSFGSLQTTQAKGVKNVYHCPHNNNRDMAQLIAKELNGKEPVRRKN